jgi:hypothetical protein
LLVDLVHLLEDRAGASDALDAFDDASGHLLRVAGKGVVNDQDSDRSLKRACRGLGAIPAARCNRDNLASRSTLQKAGFVPCGHLLTGSITK